MSTDRYVSLVIPVKNESASIIKLVESIYLQQHLPVEVVIVDGGSNDDTLSIIDSLCRTYPFIRLFQTGKALPGQGRNIGIRSASSDWIGLTDGGIVLDHTWLSSLVEIMQSNISPDLVYGNYEPVLDTFFERCAALAYVPAKVQRPGGMMRGPSIASCLLKKSVWEAVGGFPDWRAAEDLIFMRRVEEAGFRIGWAPKATVYWQLRPDLASTFRKFALYSKHNVWAGMQGDWHYGVARQYAIYLIAILMMWLQSWWWVLVPVALFAARVMKSIWTKREGRGLAWALNPVQFFGVAGILGAIDLAMFVGWFQALITRQEVEESSRPAK